MKGLAEATTKLNQQLKQLGELKLTRTTNLEEWRKRATQRENNLEKLKLSAKTSVRKRKMEIQHRELIISNNQIYQSKSKWIESME